MINLINKAKPYYYQMKGRRTDKKIIVIESDDWGGIRVNSNFKRDGNINNNPFDTVDTLESKLDFEYLNEQINVFAKNCGIKPKITTNTIMANPDFDKIRASDFKEYHYETFDHSYHRYNRTYAFESYKELINDGILYPQFHGREHVNVIPWLSAINNQDEDVVYNFKKSEFCGDVNSKPYNRANLMAAWNVSTPDDLKLVNDGILDGLNIFKEKFGFVPTSAIAPVGLWHRENEKALVEGGVKYLQGFIFQLHPFLEIYRKEYHYMGQTNSLNQMYLTRNCFFEPTTNQNHDWVASCIRQIKIAFLLKKPAIISMHRLNFVGCVSEDNRTTSITKFMQLLTIIHKEWNNVEYMFSNELGDYLSS